MALRRLVERYGAGLALVAMGLGAQIIDSGPPLPPVKAKGAGPLFRIQRQGRWGYVNRSGQIIVTPNFEDAGDFFEGLAAVQLDGKWGYIDKAGSVVVPIQYHIAHMFSEGLASVETSGKWGYVDRSGHVSIPLNFDSAMPFCAGVAEVETFRIIGERSQGCRAHRGRHAIIDHTGNYVWRDAEEQTWPSPFCD